jgi:hypothetical protein
VVAWVNDGSAEACKKTQRALFFERFPMFVPSLSW